MRVKNSIELYLLSSIIIIISTSFLMGCTSNKMSIEHDGFTRTYILHVPNNYSDDQPIPLVIVLHGGGGNSKNIMRSTGMNEKADEEGFIAAYPDGSGKLDNYLLTWNAGYCCGYSLDNEIDDVGFIRKLIENLQNNFNINQSRIYITGMSNGAMMAYRLGSELSDIIAAIAPVCGSIGGKADENSSLWIIPDPIYPVSVIAFNGMMDEHVLYEGGHGNKTSGTRFDLSVNESISFWIEQNGCNPNPLINISENKNIIAYTYDNGLNYTEVVLYTIVDGGHAWPGGNKGSERGDEPTMDISATDIMWEFFESHPKILS